MQLNIARKFVKSIVGGRRKSAGGLIGGEILARSIDGWFDNRNWEATYPDVIEEGNKSDFNPGQQSIFEEDYKPAAELYCRTFGEEYDPDAFISFVESTIGSDKFNAISETIEETSQYLYEAWDYCFGGDGVGEKLFGNYGQSTKRLPRSSVIRAPKISSIRIVGRRR